MSDEQNEKSKGVPGGAKGRAAPVFSFDDNDDTETAPAVGVLERPVSE